MLNQWDAVTLPLLLPAHKLCCVGFTGVKWRGLPQYTIVILAEFTRVKRISSDTIAILVYHGSTSIQTDKTITSAG